MVSALMHNRAWLSGNQARLASIFDLGGADATAVRQALVSAESTGYFDQAAGTASLAALVRVLRAQLHVVQGEYAKGLALYAENYRAAIEQGFEHKRSLIYADMAWCHVHLGSAAQALAQARAAADALDGECDIDDRAVSNGRLAQVFKALGDTPASQRHAEQASVNLQSHRDQQAQIIQVLGVTLAKVNTS
jgi:tetratricopeptide (TPR) repeat protein